MTFIYGGFGWNHCICWWSNAFVKHCKWFSPEHLVLLTSTFTSTIMSVSQPPICCGVWRSKLVPVCYRPPSATPNEAVMDQDGWPIKHWRKHVSSADSQPFDGVSCLLECLLRDLWPMPTPLYTPTRSLESLYYVFWSWRPYGIPRRGALASKAAH